MQEAKSRAPIAYGERSKASPQHVVWDVNRRHKNLVNTMALAINILLSPFLNIKYFSFVK
jgi:hypothetical protein